MSSARQHIEHHGDALHVDGITGDQQGCLTDRTVGILKESGGFRLLLARDLGGDEAHPNEFLDWVMATGAQQASAGWVAGVVGVHPWEFSFLHPRLQQDVYGRDPDTLTASPYAPFGVARAVDGGFLLTGEWPYSTGTDYCDWVILGGRVEPAQPAATPSRPEIRHFVLPKGDYDIVPDSWNVLGLKGTGSKNVRMRDVFVPEYRTADAFKATQGLYAQERRPGSPLYHLYFGCMFSAAICAATLGIAEGLLRAQRRYMDQRVSITGSVARSDPVYLAALAVAESDFDASRCHFRDQMDVLYRHVCGGHEVSLEQRLRFRRDQVRATDRVFESVAPLARLAGSAGIQEVNELERWWRDLQTAITHVCNLREGIYTGWGLHQFGGELPSGGLY